MRFPICNKHKNKIVVKKFNNKNGNSEVALLAFNGKIRDKIIKALDNQFLVEGDHIKNGGKASPKIMYSLLGAGAGSLGIAGATSGQLFMATANPATLMTIGNGVGSAVMGSSGIIAQAPFLPVSGALMPVVAPLIAFQALSTIAIMNEFNIVNKKLDEIKTMIERVIKRDEATFVGEVISASNRITSLEESFSISNQFTNDMIIRLALLENKINPVFERYHYLYQNQDINEKDENILENLTFKQNDALMTIISSILDIRIDLLKMKLYIQENPGYVEKSARQFKEKINYYNELWSQIKNNDHDIHVVASEMTDAIEAMNLWEKNMPEWLLGKRKYRKELQATSKKMHKIAETYKEKITRPVDTAIQIGAEIQKELDNSKNMNLIYWKDENGEHSYYTNDLIITK